MTLKSDAKFKEKLTCSFKHEMRNFVNPQQPTQKSKNFNSMSYFCLNYMKFEIKKNTEKLYFMTLNSDARFESILTLVSKMT